MQRDSMGDKILNIIVWPFNLEERSLWYRRIWLLTLPLSFCLAIMWGLIWIAIAFVVALSYELIVAIDDSLVHVRKVTDWYKRIWARNPSEKH